MKIFSIHRRLKIKSPYHLFEFNKQSAQYPEEDWLMTGVRGPAATSAAL